MSRSEQVSGSEGVGVAHRTENTGAAAFVEARVDLPVGWWTMDARSQDVALKAALAQAQDDVGYAAADAGVLTAGQPRVAVVVTQDVIARERQP